MVGPTASGKSEIAVAVARRLGGEIVSADAFQIYAGLPVLTAQPEPELRAQIPHHLVGTLTLRETLDAERFRRLAGEAMRLIEAGGRSVLVVGGSGLYVKALTDGLSVLPRANAALRARLEQFSEGELLLWLARLDLPTAEQIDRRNKRRLVRAVEVCLLSGRPVSVQRQRPQPASVTTGVFVFRDREELYARINSRVTSMFAQGVVEEVRAAGDVGATAAQTLGLWQIRDLIAGRISKEECIAAIQQATRRYAKRQLTWFQRQTSFEPLNLSRTGSLEAIEWIARRARLSCAQKR